MLHRGPQIGTDSAFPLTKCESVDLNFIAMSILATDPKSLICHLSGCCVARSQANCTFQLLLSQTEMFLSYSTPLHAPPLWVFAPATIIAHADTLPAIKIELAIKIRRMQFMHCKKCTVVLTKLVTSVA